MKKKIIVIGSIAILAVLMLGVGIHFFSPTYDITIREEIWVPNDEEQRCEQVKNEEKEYTVKINDKIQVDDDLTFKIIKGDKDSITIKTSEPMCQTGVDYTAINLNSKEKKFVVKKKEETVLHCLVMDASISYTISFKK